MGVLLRSTCLLLLSLRLEDLLDDLLFLDEEGTDNAIADAVSAARATVGTANGLVSLGELGQLAGTDGLQLHDFFSHSVTLISLPLFSRACSYLHQRELHRSHRSEEP